MANYLLKEYQSVMRDCFLKLGSVEDAKRKLRAFAERREGDYSDFNKMALWQLWRVVMYHTNFELYDAVRAKYPYKVHDSHWYTLMKNAFIEAYGCLPSELICS